MTIMTLRVRIYYPNELFDSNRWISVEQQTGGPAFLLSKYGANVPEVPRVSWRRSIYAQSSTHVAHALRQSGREREWKKHRLGEQTRKLLIVGFVRWVKDESSHSSRPLSSSVMKKVGNKGLTRGCEIPE